MYIETLFAQALIWQATFTPLTESSGPPALSAPYGRKSVTAASSMFCKFWHGWSGHCASAGIVKKQKHNTEIAWKAFLLNLIPPVKSGREARFVLGAEEGVSRRSKCVPRAHECQYQLCANHFDVV